MSKSTGVPLAKVATRVILGQKLADMHLPDKPAHPHYTVKEAVLPFSRLPGADTTLGPEMKSTGEVMGVASSFPVAFAKAQAGAGQTLPLKGTFFISVCDADKPKPSCSARGSAIWASSWWPHRGPLMHRLLRASRLSRSKNSPRASPTLSI